jgi:two-component system sensor histidine kinase/response regulator
VLVVEDNEVNRIVAKELLEGAGVKVECAGNGLEALAALSQRNFDAILMDVQMPELDGIETTRRLKADPRLRRIPVIALTAHAMTTDRERFLEAGMDDYLSKPIEEAALWRTLSRWLPQRAESDAPRADRAERRSAADASAPPGIDCIDVPSALARVNGNSTLLWRLVSEFRTRHADAAGEMRRLLDQGRRADVQALAHTLKGAAATLSARGVADAVSRIESAARHGGDIAAELPAFELAWGELAAARLPDGAGASPAPPAPAFTPERTLRTSAMRSRPTACPRATI